MTDTGLIEWAQLMASMLEANPNVESVTLQFTTGGRLHVDTDGARFVCRGETIDVDAVLAPEAYETVGALAVEHPYEGTL